MEIPHELIKTLERIGLTDKEARVYLTLLSLESATAYRIAEHCSVKKPTVYLTLEDLRKKGLVLKVPHVKKALYAPRNIEEYIAEQESRLDAVTSILPKLKTLGMKERPQVFFYTGFRGMAEAIDYKFKALHGKTLYSFFGNLTGTSDAQVKAFNAWDKKALKAGIASKIIMPEHEKENQKTLLALAKDESNIQIRFLKDYTYPSHIFINIAEDFVQILDSKNLQATIIDDPATAHALRQIFQVVWEKGI